MSHVEAANRYVRDVLSGKIPACKFVRQACERQLNDLEKFSGEGADYYFSGEAAEEICNFIEQLPHVKGEWARRREKIKLWPWQQFILTTVFGWKKANGLRRFRMAYIEVPRKNAKSTLSAGIGLYGLTKDGEIGAEVYSAATTRDQAKIVFADAQQMARKTKGLEVKYGLRVNAHNISVLERASKFEALSAEGETLDGLNVHVGIIDELHAHRTRQVFDVIETATGSRAQPLIWSITTAGSNRSGICYEQRTYITKILDSVVEDESYFGIIYTIDAEDDWTSEDAWKKANPNYGVSIYPDDIARLATKAMQLPSAQNNFLTKRLNVWVNADTAWMDMRAWERCGNPELSMDEFEGEPCIIAVDLASKIDLAAMCAIFQREGHYFTFWKYYLPEAAIENASNSQYAGWANSGRITITPGNVIDFGQIEEDLKALCSRFQVL